MAMTIVENTRPVTDGVDTHLDVHVAAALDANGTLLGVESFPAERSGYAALHRWLESFGELARVGVEGTGAYGAGLARHLWAVGVEVIEVDRPNRQERRRAGKSDTLDAVEAARAALSGRARGRAKTKVGNVEAIRALLVAKRSARSSRIMTRNQLRHLCFTAPDELRERLARLSRAELITQAAAPDRGLRDLPALLRARVEFTPADAAPTLDRHVGLLGVDAMARVEVGGAAGTICRVALETNADLIVVGSHGTGLMRRLMFGSVSETVAHHAPCPVLLMRPVAVADD